MQQQQKICQIQLIKVQNLCMEKEIINKEQRQIIDREKTFAAHITNGGFLFLRQGTSTNI